MKTNRIEKSIRIAGVLVGAGLLVDSASLTALHPGAFMAFLVIGCPLVIAGIAVYLLSLAQE